MSAGLLTDIPFGGGEVRQCGMCQRWHRITNPRLRCAVMHPPGTCCHYGDQEVPAPPSPEVKADDRSNAVQATKGRTVLYKLSAPDALAIGRSRAFGYIEGNTVAEGDVYPATVVQDWGGASEVNLKVHLDGHDNFWATSRNEGGEPGQWSWPAWVQTGKLPVGHA